MIRYIVPIISMAFLSAVGVFLKTHASTPTTSPQPITALASVQPVNDRESVSLALLTALGNSQPTPAIVGVAVEWTLAEDSGSDAMSRNNPWNTTMCGYNMISAINTDGGCGVGRYATMEDGIAANAATLEQSNFSDVRSALLLNDVDGFKRALWSSGWAESHYNYGVGWPAYQVAERSTMVSSNPISLAGDCGHNVAVALEANGGALQHVTLQPGDTFSFNASVGNPALVDFRTCAGVPGGNWCNLAARYAHVSRSLGLIPVFEDHGVGDLGGGAENSVAIWNIGGQAGSAGESQDLEITNTTRQIVTFTTETRGDSVVVIGSVK